MRPVLVFPPCHHCGARHADGAACTPFDGDAPRLARTDAASRTTPAPALDRLDDEPLAELPTQPVRVRERRAPR